MMQYRQMSQNALLKLFVLITPCCAVVTTLLGLCSLSANLRTALALCFLGVALYLRRPDGPVVLRQIGGVIALVGGVLGLDWNPGIIEGNQIGVEFLASITTVCLVILSVAVTFTGVARPEKTQGLALIAGALALVSVEGYLFYFRDAFDLGPWIAIAPLSALANCVLAVGVFFAQPSKGYAKIITSDSAGGLLLRRLLLLVVVIPPAMTTLQLIGENMGLYDAGLGRAIRVFFTTLILIAIVWSSARTIDDVDQKRRKLEYELANSLRLRDEFISIASHELKTPLTSLKIQTQSVKRKYERSKFHGSEAMHLLEGLPKMLQMFERQLERLAHLIDDMLDISRITAGTFVGTKEPMDLALLTDRVVNRLDAQFRQHGIEILTEFEPGVWIDCDGVRMEQVIENLILNAVKYGNSKPIRIKVRQDQSRQAILEVIDHGMGIDPEHHSRIFRKFERAVSAQNISGFGLGLYIANEIVRSHNGTIRVESAVGSGARFVVKLPLTTLSQNQSETVGSERSRVKFESVATDDVGNQTSSARR